MSRTLSVEVSFDLVCPWCLIGKRNLDTAIALLRQQQPDVAVDVAWRSYPLLPDIPKPGVPFASFYLRRLGSAQAVTMRQAQVREAARAAGVEIAFERIATFPNTLDAHRLVAQAQRHGGTACASAVIETLFDGYFVRGRNIGDAGVLADVAAEHGIPSDDAVVDAAVARGMHGVPHYRFGDGSVVEGAQHPAVLRDAMLNALTRS